MSQTSSLPSPESNGRTLAPEPSIDAASRARRRDILRGVLAGTLAAIAMLATMIGLRVLTGIVSLLDVLADALLLALPISLFSWMLDVFGTQAKTLLLVGLMGGLVLIGAWSGRMYAKQTAGSRRLQLARASSYGIALFGVSAVFTALYVLGRMPDAAAGTGLLRVLANLGIAAIVFSIVLAGTLIALRRLELAPGAEPAENTTAVLDRRRLITRTGFGIAGFAGAVILGREVLRIANRKTVVSGRTGEMPTAITSNDDFYVISKNFVDPDPGRGDEWFIDVGGLVTNRLHLTRSDLEAMAGPVFASTLTCISNPIAGPLIGTAEWRGAPLADVLRKAGVAAGAFKLVCEGEDGYTDSFPIERAMAPEPHIVWEMNGVPLPRLHGTPVRLIVPGLYGIKNVKWLTNLTVTHDDYQGYWQQRSWTDTAIIKTSSRIDVPGERAVIFAGATEIGGIAFAGDRGISKVEVSTDDGSTWQDAAIVENPSPGGLSWVLWKLEWTPKVGAYTLVVRATDGTGEAQTEDGAPELPDGASGWHRITVGVA